MTVDVLFVTNMRSYYQVDLFDALAEAGNYSVHVAYLLEMTEGRLWSELPEPKHPHTQVRSLVRNNRLYFNPGLFPLIASLRPRVVVICQYVGLSNLALMLESSLRLRPWIFWSESPGVRFFEVKSRIPRWLRASMRRLPLAIIRHWAAEVWGIGIRAQREYEKLLQRPCYNVPYFSDLSRFVRKKGYAPHGVVRLLFAGRYSYRKGFDILLEIIRRLHTACDHSWELTLCGAGDLCNLLNQLTPEVRSRIRDLGFKEMHQMPEIMKSHDLFICPSRYDGWGMVIPEAMAAGTPVIATNQMGSAIDIGNQEGLWLFEADNVDGMLKQLLALIQNPERLALSGRSAAKVAARYDAKVGAALLHKRLELLLSGCSSEVTQ